MAVENGNSTTPKAEKDFAQTPWWFIKSLESHLGSTIDIDVCCQAKTAKAGMYYSLEDGDDALVQDWAADASEVDIVNPLGFCNPPFSSPLVWVNKAEEEAQKGFNTLVLLPNNPETEYVREAKRVAEVIIEMPFRMKFLRPDGTPFLSPTTGKIQTPKFSCLVALITEAGATTKTDFYYHDFRVGFMPPSSVVHDIDLTKWGNKYG